jgi:acetyl-CoA acyltransferase
MTDNHKHKGSAGRRRVAVVAGLRTPFLKSRGAFGGLTGLDLGRIVVSELLARAELDRDLVDLVVFGQVVPSVSAPNVAREVALGVGLPPRVDAYSVSRACATSVQATTNAAEQVMLGHADVAIAGGTECLSDVPIAVSRKLSDALVGASRAKSMAARLRAFSGVKPRDLLPVPPALKEPSTGLTMGESAEKMAKENGITREAQDSLAMRSHDRAAQAWEQGKYKDEVMPVLVPPRYQACAREDEYVRRDVTREKMAELKPAFDRRYGTITAGNSSGLTDGAAALLLMSEERAHALGIKPLGFIKSYAYAAVDPQWQMLMGPAFATPVALDRAHLTLQDMDIVDMHEAFASVVLCNLQALASRTFAQERLGRTEAVGEVDPERLNVNGGSIALGHPFGATGARMILTVLNELNRRQKTHGLVTLCAAGGLGAAVVLEGNR